MSRKVNFSKPIFEMTNPTALPQGTSSRKKKKKKAPALK